MSEKIITAEAASFTDEQRRLITDVLVKGGTDTEVKFFFQVAERLKMDPFKRQIHAMKRYDGTLQREVLQFMVSIEGLRSIAARCKTDDGKDAYAGSSKPLFTYKPDGTLNTAEVTILKIVQGEPREFTAEVFYDECVQTRNVYEGFGNNRRKIGEEPNSMWQKRPHGQLGKCAEAAALRKAFPEETGGVYIEEELPDREDNDKLKPVTPKPQAEGMRQEPEPKSEKAHVVHEAEVVTESNEGIEARHWSDLLPEQAYNLIEFPEGSKWAGKPLWQIAKDGEFEEAFKTVPREDTNHRHALDARYFANLKTRLAKKGYDMDEATAALRKTKFLAEDGEITNVPGERLLDLGTEVNDLPALKE